MNKKLDRFEYMPGKIGIRQEDDAGVHRAVLWLLRHQHMAYVRIVQREIRSSGMGAGLTNVLARFARYKMGKS